jgi:uncharacterized membrane protein
MIKSHSLPVYLALSVLIFLLAFVLRITAIHENSFFSDEITTAITIEMLEDGETFFEAMKIHLHHMPLYFASLNIYPGENTPLSLRYPEVLWGMLTIAMTMRLLSHIYGLRRYSLLAGLILAIHAYMIIRSRDVRMYALGNFLMVTVSYLFFRYINSPQDENPNVHRFVSYITSIFVYLTHIGALILLPAQFLILGWLALKRQLRIQTIGHWMVLQALVFLPALLWIIFGFHEAETGLDWIPQVSVERVIYVMNQLFVGGRNEQNFAWYMVFILPSIIGFIVCFKHIKYAGYWVGLTAIPFMGLLFVSLFHSLFHERYLSIALFAYIVIMILGYKALDDFLIKRFKVAGKVIMWLIIGVHLINLALPTLTRFQDNYFATNYAKYVLNYVQENGKGGDYVVTSYYHILPIYYIDTTKLWYVWGQWGTYKFVQDYEETQIMPADRVWIVAGDDSSLKQLSEKYDFNPVYRHGDATVYFVSRDG